jgi:hypothetical protein
MSCQHIIPARGIYTSYQCPRAAASYSRYCTRHHKKHPPSISALTKHVKPKRSTGAGVDYAFVEHGDSKVEVRWLDKLQVFEIRTTHAGLRDSLNIYPVSGNLVHLRVGERR